MRRKSIEKEGIPMVNEPIKLDAKTEQPPVADPKVVDKLGAHSLSSPTQKESDDLAKTIFHETTEKDGVKTVVSAINKEEAEKSKERLAKVPEFRNETQSLTGTPGNTNLTEHGRLAGDKSIRSKKTLAELNAELEVKSGPNPTPNREGNELLRATNGITDQQKMFINEDTNGMADEIDNFIKDKNLSEEEKKRRLESIRDRLRSTASV